MAGNFSDSQRRGPRACEQAGEETAPQHVAATAGIALELRLRKTELQD